MILNGSTENTRRALKGYSVGGARKARCGFSHSGFSLLEIILALALSTFVIAAIGYAVHSFMLVLTDQQQQIEQKQVARSVLMMLANDARAGLQYKHSDWSIPAADVSAALGGATAGGAAPEDPAEEETEEGADTAEESRPTLIGTNTALLIDISRLPRLDEYNPIIAVHDADQQLAADVKTVGYFFSDQPPKRSNEFVDDYGSKGGLYRRQIDRSVGQYRGDIGITSSPDEYTKLIAPEISAIEFRYWDGEDWQTEWDSYENGGFPLAIEILLKIDPFRVTDPALGGNEDDFQIYRSVIHLPLAEMPPEAE